MCLQHDLDRTAERFPEKAAVTDGSYVLTFGELAALSDHLGRLLRTLGASCGQRVVYFMKRGPDCITASMGILKSGAAYIPLDQRTPPERWRQIVEDAAPIAFVCHAATLTETLVRKESMGLRQPVVCLGPHNVQAGLIETVYFMEEFSAAPCVPLPEGSPEDVAHILYTSGSTGFPKGVIISHGNIKNYTDWAIEYFDIAEGDRILGTAPFYFDMSTFDIFCALVAGATLSLATEELLLFPEKLVRFAEQEGVTIWKGVSSLLMYMCRAGVIRPGRMPSLKQIIFAGEPLAPQYLSHWMQAFPEKTFFNGYGPTEATGVSLCYRVDRIPKPGEPIPIGQPCKGAKVVILGENELPVPAGEIGELCIAGPNLARGYWNDPEKTKKQFTPPPPGCHDLGDRIYHTGDLVQRNPDGNFTFISRKDHQVKWMGYRIELAEIEANLMAHPDMRDAVALLAETRNGLTELIAFFEADTDVDSTAIANFLENRIPSYMIPKRFFQVASLPRNDRGKIARDALLEMIPELERTNDARAP